MLLDEITADVARARTGDPAAASAAVRGARRLLSSARANGFPLVALPAARLASLLGEHAPKAWTSSIDAAIAATSYEVARAARERPIGAQHPAELPAGMSAGHVLVLQPACARRDQLLDLVHEQLVSTTCVSTIDAAMREIARRRPDAVLVDADVEPPDGVLRFATELREYAIGAPIPFGVVAGDVLPQHRAAAAVAGASLWMQTPLTSEIVGVALRRLLELGRVRRPKILAIDDDPDYLSIVQRILTVEGFDVELLTEPRRVFEVLEEAHPDLVLVDGSMPELSGYDVCRILRTSAEWQDMPILFLTSLSEGENQLAAYRAGADDFVSKHASAEELVARVRGRIERTRSLRERGDRDVLTGLFRRDAFVAALQSALNHARRRERPLALAVLDLDRFKEVNDRHGHLAGDRVLVALGKLVSSRFRAEDLRGRWGGEELVLAFPDSDAASVQSALERLLDDLHAIAFSGESGEVFRTTFSAGVASFPEDGVGPAELFAAADRRMYVAKKLGRARIVCEG